MASINTHIRAHTKQRRTKGWMGERLGGVSSVSVGQVKVQLELLTSYAMKLASYVGRTNDREVKHRCIIFSSGSRGNCASGAVDHIIDLIIFTVVVRMIIYLVIYLGMDIWLHHASTTETYSQYKESS